MTLTQTDRFADRMQTARTQSIVAAVALLVTLAACGGDDSDPPAAPATPTEPSPTVPLPDPAEFDDFNSMVEAFESFGPACEEPLLSDPSLSEYNEGDTVWCGSTYLMYATQGDSVEGDVGRLTDWAARDVIKDDGTFLGGPDLKWAVLFKDDGSPLSQQIQAAFPAKPVTMKSVVESAGL